MTEARHVEHLLALLPRRRLQVNRVRAKGAKVDEVATGRRVPEDLLDRQSSLIHDGVTQTGLRR